MSMKPYDQYILGNGMVVLGEPMEGVESVAFDIMLPAGAALLPEGCCGAANVISDWIFRGAGTRDNRQLSDALDGLGLHRDESVGSAHLTVGAAMEAGNLLAALDLYADVVLRPTLEAEQFEPARQLVIEDVRSLDDDPRHKVSLLLREQFFPNPLGRSTLGRIDELRTLDGATAALLVHEYFNLSGTIIGLAGKYDFDQVCRKMEELFGKAPGRYSTDIRLGLPGRRYTHVPGEGAQVHIGLMTPTVTAQDPDYYNVRMVVSVLSGGMSGRLFTEVREKRGLCYAVGARYHGLKEAAGILCYAGTTPDKAQETVDVIMDQFRHLADGIDQEELDRAKVGLKSALILQSESSSSRACAIGSDYHVLGRVRSLEEVKQRIDAATVESVLDFLRRCPFGEFTGATIGPRAVEF